MSTTGKVKRMVRQIKQSVGPSYYAGKASYLNEYVPLIYQMVVKKLTQNKEDINEAI